MKKLLVLLTTCFLVLMGVSTLTFAQEPEQITVKLINFMVPTEYDTENYFVSYSIEDNHYIGKIIEKDTGFVVTQFSEAPEEITVEQAMDLRNHPATRAQNDTTYNTTLDGLFNLVNGTNEFQAYVYARVEITAGSYWAQCNKLLDYGQSAGNSGAFTLADKHSYDGTSKYPATTVIIDINGVIETNYTYSLSASINPDVLKALGFTLSGDASSAWYARKTYNTHASFVIMK